MSSFDMFGVEKHDVNPKLIKHSDELFDICHNKVREHMRFFDLAMNIQRTVPLKEVSEYDTISTDGKTFFYNPEYILGRFLNAQSSTTKFRFSQQDAGISCCIHEYLHTVMHCMFRHLFWSGYMERRFWDLACDIAVECMLCDLQDAFKKNNEDILLHPRSQMIRNELVNNLANENVTMVAINLYEFFMKDQELPRNNRRFCEEELQRLEELFCFDDHSRWYTEEEQAGDGDGDGDGEGKGNGDGQGGGNCRARSNGNGDGEDRENGSGGGGSSQMENRWQEIARNFGVDVETQARRQGQGIGNLMKNLKSVTREKYDYTDFLKKFAVNTEVMKVSIDEFDYNFYTYGLNLYGNIPLIEPLEYKEDKRVREFVIAIDTSGSTIFDLVEKFINKTYNILMSTESFAKKVNIHIIQCDYDIQHCAKITNRTEFESYIKNMKIYGGGGTDFRPVFDLVNKMVEEGEFTDLKGLVYFTDGYGTFPTQKPPYKTAFVFIDDDYTDNGVPVWASQLKLRSSELNNL